VLQTENHRRFSPWYPHSQGRLGEEDKLTKTNAKESKHAFQSIALEFQRGATWYPSNCPLWSSGNGRVHAMRADEELTIFDSMMVGAAEGLSWRDRRKRENEISRRYFWEQVSFSKKRRSLDFPALGRWGEARKGYRRDPGIGSVQLKCQLSNVRM